MNDALAGANVSRIVRLLERHGGEMDAIELVESGMATGLSSEDAAEAIRRMLDRGEVRQAPA